MSSWVNLSPYKLELTECSQRCRRHAVMSASKSSRRLLMSMPISAGTPLIRLAQSSIPAFKAKSAADPAQGEFNLVARVQQLAPLSYTAARSCLERAWECNSCDLRPGRLQKGDVPFRLALSPETIIYSVIAIHVMVSSYTERVSNHANNVSCPGFH